MAFYTRLSTEQVAEFMAPYELGELVDYQGIEGGIENTNYFVTMVQNGSRACYVLTLFEELDIKDLPYFCRLTSHLSGQGLAVPAPLRDRDNKAMKVLAERPALLFHRFPGHQTKHPDVEQCRQVGKMLGEVHKAARYFPIMREPHRGQQWWEQEYEKVLPHLSGEDAELLQTQVAQYQAMTKQGWKLPQGTIHGDLFVDNVLFDKGEISAMIDFYNACTGYLLYDLAIAVNDWCRDGDGVSPQLAGAFISAYAEERPFEENEFKAWPLMLETAAMRFWLSRLISQLGLIETTYDDEQVQKDPEDCRQLLVFHRQHPVALDGY